MCEYVCVYEYVCVCLHTLMSTGDCEARDIRSPELELQAVVSNLVLVLGTELGSPGGGVQTFNPLTSFQPCPRFSFPLSGSLSHEPGKSPGLSFPTRQPVLNLRPQLGPLWCSAPLLFPVLLNRDFSLYGLNWDVTGAREVSRDTR